MTKKDVEIWLIEYKKSLKEFWYPKYQESFSLKDNKISKFVWNIIEQKERSIEKFEKLLLTI